MKKPQKVIFTREPGKIYTTQELLKIEAQYRELCDDFGVDFQPTQVCRHCSLNYICLTAQASKANASIEEYRKNKYPGEYFFDEYLQMLNKPGHLFDMQFDFLHVVKEYKEEKGSAVTFDQLYTLIKNPECPYFYESYMKTKDPEFPRLFCISLGNFEGFKVDMNNHTVEYINE